MAYQEQQLSDDEKRTKSRRLMMNQISFDSDLKKNQREQELVSSDVRQLQRDITRLQMNIDEKESSVKKLKEKEIFLNGELRRIKKEMINLRG